MKIKRSLMKYRGDHCLNCDYPLEISDRYCPRCGQMNSTKKLSFNDFFEEFFSSVFAYDSRLNRTLKTLLFKPGKISKDYIEGRRMHYANPFRFYLSASIIFFLLFNYSFDLNIPQLGPQDRNVVDFRENLNRELQQANIDSTKQVLAARGINLDSIQRVAVDTTHKTYKDYMVTEKETDTMSFLSALFKKANLYYHFQDETEIYNPERALDSLNFRNTKYNHWLYKKAVDAGIFRNNPKLFFDYFISKLPFIIFFYLPVFALFIWLLYVRRPFNYMEHLIFAFHVQTTLFVLYIVGLVFDFIVSNNWGITTANILFAAYLYKSMRNFYGQGRVKTILKFIILNVIFFTLAMVAIVISLLASFSIY